MYNQVKILGHFPFPCITLLLIVDNQYFDISRSQSLQALEIHLSLLLNKYSKHPQPTYLPKNFINSNKHNWNVVNVITEETFTSVSMLRWYCLKSQLKFE